MFKFLLCLVWVFPIYGMEISPTSVITDTLGKPITSEIDELEADTTSLKCKAVDPQQCGTSEGYVRRAALQCSYKRLAITKAKGESCFIRAYNSDWAKKRYPDSIVVDKELKPYSRVAINHFATLGKEFRRIVQKKEKESYPLAKKIRHVLLGNDDIFSPSSAEVELKKKKESEPRSKHAESALTLLKTYGAILASASLEELLKAYEGLGIKTIKEGFEPSVCRCEKDFREFASTTSFGSKENFLKCWEASKDWLSLRAEKQEMWKDADKQKKNMLIIVLLSEVSRMKHVRPEIVALAINLVKQYGGGEDQEASLLSQAHDANLFISKLEDRMTFPRSLNSDGEDVRDGKSQRVEVVVERGPDVVASSGSTVPVVSTGPIGSANADGSQIVLEKPKASDVKTLPAMDQRKINEALKKIGKNWQEFLNTKIDYLDYKFGNKSITEEEKKLLLEYHARGQLKIVRVESNREGVLRAQKTELLKKDNVDKINAAATYLLTLLSTEEE